MTPDANPTKKSPMRKIGRFIITDKLGSGSNGNVYLGHDPVIDRQVAIKILNNPTGTSDKAQREQQFINEARAAGRLSHPNIVTIFDASTENGSSFIAMEFLQGKDLRSLIDSGTRFTPIECASIVYKVAGALAYAHGHGVIHRDIKPGNIFVLENNQPKVVDFGIARVPNRAVDADGQPQTLFKNNIMGTPNYMSPEQAMSQPVTALTDVYSLGAVLYELVTGQKPFIKSDFEQLLSAIIRKTPKEPHLINPKIPEKLSYIIMKAIRKKPSQRYQGAAEMAKALNKFIVESKRNKHDEDDELSNWDIWRKKPIFWFSCVALFIATVIISLSFTN
jgi:serine/threonine-protein kinase